MYEPGTILTRKDPRPPEEAAAAYNRVKVIAASPISHAGTVRGGEWEGGNAQGVILQPAPLPLEPGEKPREHDYGQNLDEPFGKVQKLYDVESIPEPDMIVAKPVERVKPGPTPEEVFAREAPGTPRLPDDPRARSPLPDPAPDASELGPLDQPPVQPVPVTDAQQA
jgi:hypothetical protein